MDRKQVITLAIGTALGILIATWLMPFAKRLPPVNRQGE